MRKPNQPMYAVEFSKYYTLSDVYIGAVLELNKFKFEVVDADEYAYNYLEKHAKEVSCCLTHDNVFASLQEKTIHL